MSIALDGVTEADMAVAREHPMSEAWALERALGVGGSADVYLLRDKFTGRLCVGKQFRVGQRYTKLAHRELCILKRLSHINIVTPLTLMVDRPTSRPWLYMEDGGTALVDMVIDGQPSDECITSWCRQLIEAVRYLHSRSIAHMDLKLDNITVSADGVIKIIDLGLAHVYEPGDPEVCMTSARGSESYIAPEIFMKKQYSAYAADIWSLGICLFGLNAGRFPFERARPSDPRFNAIVKWQGADDTECATSSIRLLVGYFRKHASIPSRIDEWIDIIERMIRVDPSQRIRLQD